MVRSLFTLATILATSQALAISTPGWVEGKLQHMTLEEKIGQILMIALPGPEMTPAMKSFLKVGKFGGLILFDDNIVHYEQVKLFNTEAQRISKTTTGIPLLIAVDQEGGSVNRLGKILNLKAMSYSARTLGHFYAKQPAVVGAALKDFADRLAESMEDLGFNMNLAPVLDIATEPGSAVSSRSFGDDPALVQELSTHFVEAMANHGIIATGKHFPGLGSTEIDSHFHLPVISMPAKELFKNDWQPFRRLREDLGAVMVGHAVVKAIDPLQPATLSSKVIKVLRKKVGYKGLVITDDLKMGAVANTRTIEEIAPLSFLAGCDMLLVAMKPDEIERARRSLYQAYRKGQITKKRLDQSVRRILMAKHRYHYSQ